MWPNKPKVRQKQRKRKPQKLQRLTVEDNASAQFNQAVHVPMVSDEPSSKDLATIVSEVVLEGLKEAGLISHHPQPSRHDKDDSNPAATVQGSVAVVIVSSSCQRQSTSINCRPILKDTPLGLDNIFHFGFPIDYVGDRINFSSPNLLSAITNPTVVDEKLGKEIQLGRIVGPFYTPPFPAFHVSTLGFIPKKVPGEFRIIHHLSFPEGRSINSHIPKIASRVTYANVDDAIRLIRRSGRGCALAKTDIKNAFRLIPVRPSDYNLLGICWRNKYYVDRNLAMGLSSSCKIFECFSTALEWIARDKLQITGILHLLDDFLIVSQSLSSCDHQLKAFLGTCNDIGVPMAPEKTVGPSCVLSFAGIELDTNKMEARLPNDKLTKCRSLIQEFICKKKVTLQELQSLIGLLNFTCSVIVPGRTFLRRLINLTVGIKRPRYFIRLNRETRSDLKLWLTFLNSYNGRLFFLDYIWLSSAKLHLYTDAAGSLSYGAVFGRHWFYSKWPDNWLGRNIIVLEMFAYTCKCRERAAKGSTELQLYKPH